MLNRRKLSTTVILALLLAGLAPAALMAQVQVTASPSSLTFLYQIGQQLPAQQVVQIGGAANVPVSFSWTTNSGGNWLIPIAQGSVTPTTINVLALPSGLAKGTYTGSITITSSQATGAPLSVAVTLVVSDTPLLTANPAALSFSQSLGASVPPGQQVTIASTGAQLGLSVAATTSTGGAWLLVDQVSGSTPLTLNVSLNATALGTLGLGTYSGKVTVASAGAGNSPLEIPVTLVVESQRTLTISPAELKFSFQIGGPAPPNQTLTLTNTGSPLTYTALPATASGGGWLAVAPESGSTPANLTVIVNPAGLPAGTYNGTIAITAPGATNSPQTVNVSLLVTTDPLLSATPSTVSFQHQVGTAAPAPQLVLLSNSGAGLGFTVQSSTSTGAGWLQATPVSGTTPAGVLIRVNPASLTAGTYNGKVAVTAPGSANSPLEIPVTLRVSATPLLTAAPQALQFLFQTGGTSPGSQTLAVRSTGTAVNFSATSTVSGGGTWLTLSAASGTTPADLTVAVNPTGLVPGTYNATISLLSTDSGASPLLIPVTLRVSDTPLLVVPSQPLTFSWLFGAAQPDPQTLQVGSTGTAFNFQATATTASGVPWLLVTPSAGVTGSSISVGVNPTGLPEGTHTGLIRFEGPGIANSPVFVPVLFTVSTSSNLVITPGPLSFDQPLGGAAPAAKTLTVSSSGTILTYTATVTTLTGGNWLSINPVTGLTPSNIAVSVNGAGLPAGSYSGSVIISAQGAANSPQVVPITLNVVRPLTTISASPATLAYSATQGGPAPVAQSVQITSAGDAVPISFQASTASGGNWLSAVSSSNTTPASLTVSVSSSSLPAGTYNGTITVTSSGASNSPLTIPVTLTVAAATPAPRITRFVNAASFIDSPAAPGMIATIGGTNIGPAAALTLQTGPDGRVRTELGGVRVLFEGIAAPLIAVSSTQVSCVVPYAMAGRLSTRVQVEYQNSLSNQLELRVVDAVPGLFSANQSGSGQGAILNQDGSVNSPNNPAARDSVVVIYATGEGQTSPPGLDGSVTPLAPPFKSPLLPVRVNIGGREAQVLYAGAAPGFISGLLQINARIAADAATGSAVPVVVTIGNTASQSTVTLAVR